MSSPGPNSSWGMSDDETSVRTPAAPCGPFEAKEDEDEKAAEASR